jgi:hypothetical protein
MTMPDLLRQIHADEAVRVRPASLQLDFIVVANDGSCPTGCCQEAASVVQGWGQRMLESLAIVGAGVLVAIGVGLVRASDHLS